MEDRQSGVSTRDKTVFESGKPIELTKRQEIKYDKKKENIEAVKYDPEMVAESERDWRIDRLKDHFQTDWSEIIRVTSFAKTGSGYPCVPVFNEKNCNVVLDLGCGNNIFKGHINNLIGIDLLPWNGRADIVMDCLEYLKSLKSESIDGIRSVGPFNFGTEDEVLELLFECSRVLRPGGLICAHARPGRISDSSHFNRRGIIHFPWTRDKIKEFSDLCNLELQEHNLSVPAMKQDIITEWTDLMQLTWPQLNSYIGRYDEKTTTVDEWNRWLDRNQDNGDMIDPTEMQEVFHDIHVKCLNEKFRRLNDPRHSKEIGTGVRPRFNWWWKKPTNTTLK